MSKTQKQVLRRPHTYVLSFLFPAGTIQQFPLQIDQGYDFEWISKIAFINSGTGTGPFFSARIGIQDSATGRQLILSSPPPGSSFRPDTTEMSNYFGTATLPALHVQPYVFKRGTVVWVTVDTSHVGGENVQGEIAFEGFDLIEQDTQGRGHSGQLVQMTA